MNLTVTQWIATTVLSLLTGGGSALLLKLVTARQDYARASAETRKIAAEAVSIEGQSWAALLERYRQEREQDRKTLEALEEEVSGLRYHTEVLEDLMRNAGLVVPPRPKRRVV